MEKTIDHIKVEFERGFPVCTVVYKSKDKERHFNTTFSLLLKKILQDDQFQQHLTTKKAKTTVRKNAAKPYVARFNRISSTYQVVSTATGIKKSAVFYYPDPATANIENILNYNMQLAKQRHTTSLAKFELQLREKVHTRLQRILGENYEIAYKRPTQEGQDPADGPFYSPSQTSLYDQKSMPNIQEPVKLADVHVPYLDPEPE